ncbi:MAG: hypothetical protein UIG59_07480 [Acutalibacteraceae bacterium]|nr:hypothetical protein [Acutalibacteraceae bacterium]
MQGIGKALRFIFDRFYCKDTGLIYDFLIDGKNAWHHLPSPEDVKRQNPNPCGWGTGMEDSVLNGGSAIDALVGHYAATHDEWAKKLCLELFEGMMLCATVSEHKGFIARSVSPADKKSYYINSSRDQYTHWIYAAVRLYDSPIADDAVKNKIREVLVAVAEKCLRDVTEENGFELLRADGKAGIVSKMWGKLGAHEYLRLPMFYMAAYYVSGDEKWKCEADKYRFEALEKTKTFQPHKHSTYVLLQLQYSLRLMYDLCPEKNFKTGCLALMDYLSDYGENNIPSVCKRLEGIGRLNFKYKKWNVCCPIDCGEYGGYKYLNPAQSELKENTSFYPLRAVGELASLIALHPEKRVDPNLPKLLDRLADGIDYDEHYTYAPLLVACGYMLCEENTYKNKITD